MVTFHLFLLFSITFLCNKRNSVFLVPRATVAVSALANSVILRFIVCDPSLLEEEEVMMWSLRTYSSLILWTESVLVAEMHWVHSWRISSGLAAPRTLLLQTRAQREGPKDKLLPKCILRGC